MAVSRSNDSQKERITYKWGNSGPNYWQKDNNTVLQSSIRKSEKNVYELILKIQTLDDDGKFVKNEDGTYDNGYFNFSANEIARISYQLEQMFPTNDMDNGTIGGIIVNHISAQTNNGSQFEIVSEEDGVYLYISYVTNAEVTAEYKHLLSNDQALRFYNSDGDEEEETINMDLVSIKALFNSAYALISGLVDSVFETNGFSINGRSESKTGGKVNGGMQRRISSTLGSKKAQAVSEDDEDEDNSSNSKSNRKPVSKIAKLATNLKNLLDDDDEEDD
jgi:hypothetical protein